MKKLLALVLCVMLFVSVIPTAAFANTSANSAVSLYNAVQQMNSLYSAYGELAAKTFVVDTFKGFKELANAFPKDSYARLAAISAAVGISGAAPDLWNNFENIIKDGYVISPEGLFELFGDEIAALYDFVGQGVVTDTKLEYLKVEQNIMNAIADLYASIKIPDPPVVS